MPSVGERLCQASILYLASSYAAEINLAQHRRVSFDCVVFSNKELEERADKRYGETYRETGMK